MSDENAEKAWAEYLADHYVPLSIRPEARACFSAGFMAGRASRDAEVDSLHARVDDLIDIREKRDTYRRDQIADLEQQLAERDAVIERVRAVALVEHRWGAKCGVGYGSLMDVLDAAPSSTLDALIRQKQAEALEGWADEVQPHFPVYAEKTRERAAEYRNGADHE